MATATATVTPTTAPNIHPVPAAPNTGLLIGLSALAVIGCVTLVRRRLRAPSP